MSPLLQVATFINSFLKFNREPHIKLTSRQIIRDGILDIVDIRDPIVAAYIGDIKKIEHIHTENDTLEMPQEIFWRFLIGRSSDKLPA